MVTNPAVFNVLPYKHNYTPDGRYVYTAMFIPAHRMISSLLDSRGWCDSVEGKAWYDVQREKKAGNPKALLI
jgi:hypothetical protein